MSGWGVTPDVARSALRALAGDDDDATVLERYARAVWSGLIEPGDRVAGDLIARLGAVGALGFAMDPPPAARSDEALARGLDRWTPRLSTETADDALATADRAGVQIIVPGDDAWPSALDDLGEHVPLALWVRGDAALLRPTGGSVAIVGARAATRYGELVATELAGELASDGVAVVSGAAYGIDGAAHRAALARDGRTIALLAGGAERAYPVGHTRLVDMIAEQGVVVSEVPCGTAPTKWRFLQRNRLIAALADATVVVEAGWRSGSLNTAGHAQTLGRGLGAVPGPITSAASAGCHRLLREYGAVCVTGADDVRELLGTHPPRRPVARDPRPPTDDAARVRDALSTRVRRDADEIARRAGMSRDDVETHLGLLRLAGEVERSADGWRRVPASP